MTIATIPLGTLETAVDLASGYSPNVHCQVLLERVGLRFRMQGVIRPKSRYQLAAGNWILTWQQLVSAQSIPALITRTLQTLEQSILLAGNRDVDNVVVPQQ